MKSITVKDGIGTGAGAAAGFLVSLAFKKGDKGLRKHKAIVGLAVGAVVGFAATKWGLPMLSKKTPTPTA